MLASKVITMQDNSAHGEDSFLSKELGNGEFLDVVMDGVTAVSYTHLRAHET